MFTRNMYQDGEAARQVAQSTAPLVYKMAPQQYTGCAPCEQPFGSVASRSRYAGTALGGESIASITDSESILRGQSTTYQRGSGRDRYFNPPKTGPVSTSRQSCPQFTPQHSLLSHPRPNYREQGLQTGRMFQREHEAVDYLDPRNSVDTRTLAKDSYVMKLPQPLSFTPDPSLIKKGQPKRR